MAMIINTLQRSYKSINTKSENYTDLNPVEHLLVRATIPTRILVCDKK